MWKLFPIKYKREKRERGGDVEQWNQVTTFLPKSIRTGQQTAEVANFRRISQK